MTRPKDIGTGAETAVVRALRRLGFPDAERRALAGSHDLGDIVGTPGVCWEVKGGRAAEVCTDGDLSCWLDQLRAETANSGSEVGVLVTKRKAVGPAHAESWWAWMFLADVGVRVPDEVGGIAVRMKLKDAVAVLYALGYGQPNPA